MRYLFSFILALQMSLFVCISSYAAGFATASDAVKVASESDALRVASGSEASRPLMLYNQMMQSISLYSSDDSDLPTVSNTVSYDRVYYEIGYYDMSNRLHWVSYNVNSSGYASIPLPSDFASLSRFAIIINDSSLPAPGTYNFSMRFSSNTGVSYNSLYLYSRKNNTNAAAQASSQKIDFSQLSGDFYFSSVVDLGSSLDKLQVDVYPTDKSSSVLPFGGYVNINFTKSSSQPAYTTAGGSYTSADAASDTANNTAQIVEKQDEVIDQIVATTETISMQISAFWNQLAGELTNLFNKMNEHHQEDLDKVDEQIENDNANTQEVTGAIEKHGNFIIEGLKSLFIPSDQFFKVYFDDLYDWFSDRFGFLSFPIDLLIRLADMFINSSEVDCVLTLPSFSVMDQELWPDMSFNFTEFLNENFSFLLTAIRTVSSIGLIMAFVGLCERKWEEVMLN